MRVALARVGARGVDTDTPIDAAHASALHAAGVDFVVSYLGLVTPTMLGAIVGAGLGFMPVTYADAFDGADTCAALGALAIPRGTTVWLDVEGIATLDPQLVKSRINAWAESVEHVGMVPGLYVGEGCPLTSLELYRLAVVRYWRAPSLLLDRNGQPAEPACGWCMHQLFPSLMVGGIWSDFDFIGEDDRGRLPAWVEADAA